MEQLFQQVSVGRNYLVLMIEAKENCHSVVCKRQILSTSAFSVQVRESAKTSSLLQRLFSLIMKPMVCFHRPTGSMALPSGRKGNKQLSQFADQKLEVR